MKAFQKVVMIVVAVFLSPDGPLHPTRGLRVSVVKIPPPDGGSHLLMKYQMDNITVNVIAELTGKTVETLQASLAENDMRTLLEANAVDETLFRETMKLKVVELVNEALANGHITQSQADLVIEKINSQSDMARP